MEHLTWNEVRAWRLERQHLRGRAPAADLIDVVADVCGVHAQVQSSAELQLWARVESIGPQDIRDALWERRELVRTWSLRGTLHVLPARDLPLYVAGFARTIDGGRGRGFA